MPATVSNYMEVGTMETVSELLTLILKDREQMGERLCDYV